MSTDRESPPPPNVIAYVKCEACGECGYIQNRATGAPFLAVLRRYPQMPHRECDQHRWVRDDD